MLELGLPCDENGCPFSGETGHISSHRNVIEVTFVSHSPFIFPGAGDFSGTNSPVTQDVWTETGGMLLSGSIGNGSELTAKWQGLRGHGYCERV